MWGIYVIIYKYIIYHIIMIYISWYILIFLIFDILLESCWSTYYFCQQKKCFTAMNLRIIQGAIWKTIRRMRKFLIMRITVLDVFHCVIHHLNVEPVILPRRGPQYHWPCPSIERGRMSQPKWFLVASFAYLSWFFLWQTIRYFPFQQTLEDILRGRPSFGNL